MITVIAVTMCTLMGARQSIAGLHVEQIAGSDLQLKLVDAIEHGDQVAVRALLKAGADPNAPEPVFGMTPLYAAAGKPDETGLMDILLDAGAQPDLPLHNGERPIHAAADTGSFVNLAALLEAGADACAPTESGLTALHVAAGNPIVDRDVIEALMRLCPVESRNAAGATPLHCAVYSGAAEVVARLLESGADPSVVPEKGGEVPGLPPLMLATAR